MSSTSKLNRYCTIFGLIAVSAVTTFAGTTTVLPEGGPPSPPMVIPHGSPQTNFQNPEQLFVPGWEITLLPVGYEGLQVSSDGKTVLMRDQNNAPFRWKGGFIERLGREDSSLFGMNNAGAIAIGSTDLGNYGYFSYIKTWQSTDASFSSFYKPPLVTHTGRDEYGNQYSYYSQLADLLQLDDQNRLWVSTIDSAGEQIIAIVGQSGSSQVLAGQSHEAWVSRGGHVIAYSYNFGYSVDGSPINVSPVSINDHGVWLSYLNGAGAGDLSVHYPDGRTEVLPDHPVYAGVHIVYGAWLDNQDRVNGLDVVSYSPILLQKKLGTDGHPIVPLQYDIIPYMPLIFPAGWTTDHMVAPGATAPQLGIVMNTTTGVSRSFVAVPVPSLTVDANRDGQIKLPGEVPLTDPASDETSFDKPFRFWINDDGDNGETGGSDIPMGIAQSGSGPMGPANWQGAGTTFGVDGNRDLVDFFPVYLDIKRLLTVLPASTTIKYKLKHADDALNFVYTNLTRDRALAYQKELMTTGFGPDFIQPAGAATTTQITAAGADLSEFGPAFLEGIKTSGWGVVLIEGRKATTAPLVLSVEKSDGTVIAEVKLEIKISPVEEMFRHVDLTGAAKNYSGSASTPPEATAATHIGDPGEPWPDSLTNGKYFVFVHGYNVDGQKARGWNCEVFKRMHVLGSKARFVGVTWHGATGLDYHKAVYQAFPTGDVLKTALTFTGSADVTIAAHSLGNMVVSHAIQSGGYSPSRYYMINAAVPIEAYDLANVDAAQRTAMIEDDWKSRNARFYAANWHQLFSATPADHRNELSWKNCFARVTQQFAVYSFYSPGEDVVANVPETDTAAVGATIMSQGFNFTRGAWKAQELVKGVNWTTSLAELFMERGQGGWDSDLTYLFTSHASITNEQLKTRPFFDEFKEDDLISADPTIASAKAGEVKVQYDLLARGLPALSYAVAANRISALDQVLPSRNFNMETEGRTQNQWPSEGHTSTITQGRWLHSDFKNAALPYVYQMYEAMIAKGSLK